MGPGRDRRSVLTEARNSNQLIKMDTLILTGYGYWDYALSAASLLRALKGEADVFGMSRRRLPEFLSDERATWKRIYLLGISLAGDPEMLYKALTDLKGRNVQVIWICTIAVS